MRRILIIISFVFIFIQFPFAQNAELSKLMVLVKQLRNANESTFNEVTTKLSSDMAWTPMNEFTVKDAAECRASDRVAGFKLNKAMSAAEQKRRFEISTGNMLNGENPNFQYSLYERAIKPNSSLSYSLKGRYGQQCFVIIPYDNIKKCGLQISISVDNQLFNLEQNSDCYIFTGNVPKGKTVDVKITNNSSSARSYAILNYNSRK